MSKPDILPDSRAREMRGQQWDEQFGWMVPIFCASCGKPGGYVPEQNMDFVSYLCDDPCAKLYGEDAAVTLIPDEVYWRKIEEEQLERYGRVLSLPELQAVVDENASPLARLILKGRQERGSIR